MAEALIPRLLEALRCLPGVGPKSAQRMGLHLLERDRSGAEHLARTLLEAMQKVRHCRQCRTFTEHELCEICASPRRDQGLLCVVESPADVLALEQATGYQGRYFVLLGRLSPVEGIGPKELELEALAAQLAAGGVREVILATNPTVEGEATAYYISEMCRERGISATRIAHGVPLGGELEYLDRGTLAHAFAGRRSL